MKIHLGKMKLEFKKALVPICTIYFFLLFSFGLIQPYFTLQLRTLGLTLDDAALIGESQALTYCSPDSKGGVSPFAAFAFAPILGYLGDKVVIIDSIILVANVKNTLPSKILISYSSSL